MAYILCKVRRASVPYYIENVGINIYSIEELCYYMVQNIYLLDHTIINEGLIFWLRDELGLKVLAKKLYQMLDMEDILMGDFILPIFKEINYLTFSEFKELNKDLKEYEEQPLPVKLKMKGDYLFKNEKFIGAIHVYEETLLEVQETNLGSQFIGSIYFNSGCAYAKLFQAEESLECFGKAYEILHSGNALKSYLYAQYLCKGKHSYDELAASLKVDLETKQQMDLNIEAAKAAGSSVLPADIDTMLDIWTKNYHKNTGM